MNNKGFTLIELLATIVILGIVMGIAVYGVTTAINNSKLKSERIFTEKIGNAIQSYLAVYGSTFTEKESGINSTIKKCKRNNECSNINIWEINNSGNNITINTITEVNLKTINKSDLINPKNKKNCVEGSTNPEIRIFKDNDYVYYYYLNLKGNNTTCEITDENAIVTNIPSNISSGMCTELEGTYTEEKGCIFYES